MLLAWGRLGHSSGSLLGRDCVFQLPAISMKNLISAVKTRWLKLCNFEGKKKYFKQCLGQQIENLGSLEEEMWEMGNLKGNF